MKIYKNNLLMAAGLVALCAPVVAQAETDDVIVVTAQKREQSLQDTPLSVSAISGDDLERIGAVEFNDYFRTVPGVAVIDYGPGKKQYIVRGINSSRLIEGGLVAQYVGEFPISAGTQSDVRLYDIERVEVLRGPQGTLYGRGSMGGTVKTVLREADSTKYEGFVEGRLSTTDKGGENYFINGGVNIPVIEDKLAIRAVGYFEDLSGFIDNAATGEKDINSSDVQGGRVNVRWTPTDNFDLSFTALFQDQTSDSLNEDTPGFMAPPSPLPPFLMRPWFPAGVVPGEFETIKAVNEFTKDQLQIYNLTGNLDLGFATVTSSSTYFITDRIGEQDVAELEGYGAKIYNFGHDKTFSQEVRVTSQPGVFEYTIGGFFLHTGDEFGDTGQQVYLPDESLFFDLFTKLDYTEYAAFGEVYFHLTDTLTATAGGRIAKYDRTVSTTADNPAPFDPNPNSRNQIDQSSEVFKAQLAWEPTEDALMYAMVAEGFRTGGFNAIAQIDPTGSIPYEFGSDSLRTYEIGAKTTWWDGRLTANFAAYYTDWSDVQVGTLGGPQNAFVYTSNAGKASVIGIEGELNAEITENLSLAGTFSIQQAEIDEDQPGSCTADERASMNPSCAFGPGSFPGLAGDRLPLVPEQTFSLQAHYRAPLGEGMTAFFTPIFSYTGGSYTLFRPEDPLNRKNGAYTLLNLRAGVEFDDWTATLFVQNATNKRARLLVNNISGFDKVNVNRPRTIGISLRKDF